MAEPSPEAVEELFQELADLDPLSRLALLDIRCAGDPKLRAAVEELLNFDAKAQKTPDFLRGPGSDLRAAFRLTEYAMPASFGRYRVLRRLGEGGMGTVYEAEQDAPPRTVALKVIRSDRDSPDSRKRFAREVRILGKLDHAGIARVYDSGVTDDGRLYLAMEYVQGLRLDEHFRRQTLDIRARLDLVARVCDAVQHAHEQGVVHRDLKPANILVHENGEPKILDFGVAQATGAGHPGTTIRTRTGQLIGTLGYMSPEQVAGDPRALDARSDVYTLGVILFELLAGRLPYRLDDLPVPEIVRVIRDEEPSRLGSMDRRLRGEVETIVARALDKERARRYQSAGELAEDLRRHMDRKPIRARRIGLAKRYWRWACRHPGIATLGGVLAGLLVVTTIVSLFAAARFSSLADQNRIMAESEFSARQEASRRAKAEALARETADRARIHAEKSEREANKQRNRADNEAEVAQRNLYHAQMHLSLQAWREHRGLPHMRELLADWLPKPDSPDRRGWEWFYLNSLPYQNLRTLTEGKKGNEASAVAWHVSSRRLAEGTSRGLIRIWDVDRERVSLSLRGPTPTLIWGGTAWLGWSPDGSKLAAGGDDGSVHLWETGSGRELKVLRGHKSPIRSVGFHPDGTRLACWRSDGAIKIWDLTNGRVTAEVTHPGLINTGEWSPDGTRLASGHFDGTVTISGDRPGDRVVTLKGPGDTIYCLAWSPDGTRLASTSANDFAVRIWEVAAKKIVLGPLRHSHAITALAWEPDGRRLASGSLDDTVKIWDATTGREAQTLRGHVDRITSLSWGPEGRLASTAGDGSLRIWNSISDQESTVLPGHSVRATSVSWNPIGQRLASGGDDGIVRVWDTSTRKEVATFKGHDERRTNPQFGLIRALAWSPDGTQLASAGVDGTTKVWNVFGDREVFTLPGDFGAVWAVGWSPDGTRLAVGYEGGTIRVVEGLKDTPRIASYKAHNRHVLELAWNPQGDRLASVGTDGLLKLWDSARGVERMRIQVRATGSVFGVAWSPDGKRLASAGADSLVIAWDAETGRKLSTMRGHNDFANAVAWSPDGTRLASAGFDNSVRVWDPRTGEETFVLRGNAGTFHDVAWSPNGTRLAAASSDGQIWIWDATRGFERDTTPRALPYLDRMVASGTARGEDLRWYAESSIRAGKFQEDLIISKDDPDPLSSIRPSPQLVARVDAGVAAFRQGRLADAIMSLQAVSDRLQVLRAVLPDPPELTRLHGTSLSFLAGSLRDSRHQSKAQDRFRELIAVHDSLGNPNPADLYQMACDCAMVSALDRQGSTEDREKLETRAVEYLRRAIAVDKVPIRSLVATSHDLDPLRRRADFRDMLADASFPGDPFVEPSPITIAQATPTDRRIKGEALIAKGRTLDAIPYLASAWEANPKNNLLALKVAALQGWFHQDAELNATCRKARDFASGTGDAGTADAAAKSRSIRPSDDPVYRAATLALARSAYELGKGSGNDNWFLMGLGMAEHRAGHHEAAAEALQSLIGDGSQISITSAFYLAMSLSRQGKDNEARRVAMEAISKMRPLPLDEANPLAGGVNHDDLILWMACKEATALLRIDPGSASPSEQ